MTQAVNREVIDEPKVGVSAYPRSMKGWLASASGGLMRPSRRRSREPVAWILRWSVVWLSVVLVVAITVQWLPLHSYVTPAGPINQAPGLRGEFLGTDNIGRSTLSRLAYGDRVSITISFASTTIALVLGTFLGLLSAYFRGVWAIIVNIATNSVLAVPPLLLLLAIVLALRPSLVNLTGALSLIFVPAFVRLSRANAVVQLSRDYVIAAEFLGARSFRLMLREVLPNSILPVLSYGVLVLPSIVVIEGSLSFLGFGVQPPTPSWGGMIAGSEPYLSQSVWPAAMPCIVLFLTVYALNTVGDSLRRRFDVRELNI